MAQTMNFQMDTMALLLHLLPIANMSRYRNLNEKYEAVEKAEKHPRNSWEYTITLRHVKNMD